MKVTHWYLYKWPKKKKWIHLMMLRIFSVLEVLIYWIWLFVVRNQSLLKRYWNNDREAALYVLENLLDVRQSNYYLCKFFLFSESILFLVKLFYWTEGSSPDYWDKWLFSTCICAQYVIHCYESCLLKFCENTDGLITDSPHNKGFVTLSYLLYRGTVSNAH